MVLEGERQQREQSRNELESKEVRKQLDDLKKEVVRLHMLVDYEFMALRVWQLAIAA